MRNYNMILTERQQIYQHYQIDKYEYLTSKEILLPGQKN